MPKVSVIIPTHNRANKVGNAIQSVLNQTYKDWELIVVDDASTDNTKEVVLLCMLRQENSVRYYNLNKNSGSSAAPRNAGIKAAKGKYIALLDDDDNWEPTYLEKMVSKMETLPDKVGLLYCTCKGVFSNSTILLNNKMQGKLWPDALIICISPTCGSLIRKECFDKVGLFEEKIEVPPHWDMWIRLAKEYEFAYIEDTLATFNHENETVGHQTFKNTTQRILNLLKKHEEDYAKHPAQKRQTRWLLAHMALTSSMDGSIKPLSLYSKAQCIYYGAPWIVLNQKDYKGCVKFMLNIISPKLEKYVEKHVKRLRENA